MARNEEKAQGLMNRWTTMKQDFSSTFRNKRPFLASECKSIGEAERWRREIVKDLSQKVAKIQNAGAGEHVIRDLNDQINKLMGQKRFWERRIVELGGADLGRRGGGRAGDADGGGVSLPGGGKYKYFGAAKNLPGVRELFEHQEQLMKERHETPSTSGKKNNVDMKLPMAYYGYQDEELDLLQLEADAEAALIDSSVTKWQNSQ